MTRSEQREQGFLLMFESLFSDMTTDELMDSFHEMMDEKVSGYAQTIIEGIYQNKEQIDNLIDDNTRGWTKERISKTALSVLSVAIYEMLFESKVPASVAINEAVELAKKYGADKDPAFVNGILGTINKKGEKNVD